ncbi:uncharacterized protein LOC120631707 [Pararge aegeria]|uniref:uncharacterized protein LOC120631707 n=1 Tax=Pararge aegeria TaxID=116150 RepID=UPI0019D028F7|nr:uncharacterized protein LOC120631707 [Pararge aegeria]
MTKYLLLIIAVTKVYEVASLPNHYQKSKELQSPLVIHHESHPTNTIPQLTRKKKGPNLPYQFLVPNLHVIPISHQIHTDNAGTQRNVTQQLIPVLIPFHSYVHDLTVIPLHRVSERSGGYRMSEEVDRFRNPLGGYGVGWPFGGHGAGHGFHYTYYI